MRVSGSCYCGKVSFSADVDPSSVTICHCTDCQKLTGSAYRVSVSAPADTFELRGEPSTFIKIAGSGRRRLHAFCSGCGSPIYAAAPENPDQYTLRVGSLDERASLPPSRQIWCQSALGWSSRIDDLPRHERGR